MFVRFSYEHEARQRRHGSRPVSHCQKQRSKVTRGEGTGFKSEAVQEMAFAPLRQEPIPFSDIAHIDPFTMAYVLSLREAEGQDDMMKNLSEEDRKLLEAENAPLRKGNPPSLSFIVISSLVIYLLSIFSLALNLFHLISSAFYYRSSKV